MTTANADLLAKTLGSSILVACVKCGSSATYRGSPKEINDAARVFYEIHDRCWQRERNQQ